MLLKECYVTSFTLAVYMQVRGDIELENVRFCYPTRPDRLIFDGFSLTIPAGAIWLITTASTMPNFG